jgi:hypothetical protein
MFKFLSNNTNDSIPIPESITREYDRIIFTQGWLAYQRGVKIYESPYNETEEKRMWEYGYTQSYVQLRLPSDEDLHQTGWVAARGGYPSHVNPYLPGSDPHTMWNIGWNDFINTH